MYCWGRNSNGELGNGGTSTDPTPTPVEVAGDHSFASVSAGWRHTCGILTNAAVYCWGGNGSGQLGNNTTTDSPTPVEVAGGHAFAAVSAGFSHTCGIRGDGTALCWGHDAAGRLGNGAGQVSDSIPHLVSTTLRFTGISASIAHTCAVTGGGGAYCWGDNTFGMLGNGSDFGNTSRPGAVSSNRFFTSINAGQEHTCGVTRTGVYCWGHNHRGQLGDGTMSNSLIPVRVRH